MAEAPSTAPLVQVITKHDVDNVTIIINEENKLAVAGSGAATQGVEIRDELPEDDDDYYYEDQKVGVKFPGDENTYVMQRHVKLKRAEPEDNEIAFRVTVENPERPNITTIVVEGTAVDYLHTEYIDISSSSEVHGIRDFNKLPPEKRTFVFESPKTSRLYDIGRPLLRPVRREYVVPEQRYYTVPLEANSVNMIEGVGEQVKLYVYNEPIAEYADGYRLEGIRCTIQQYEKDNEDKLLKEWKFTTHAIYQHPFQCFFLNTDQIPTDLAEGFYRITVEHDGLESDEPNYHLSVKPINQTSQFVPYRP